MTMHITPDHGSAAAPDVFTLGRDADATTYRAQWIVRVVPARMVNVFDVSRAMLWECATQYAARNCTACRNPRCGCGWVVWINGGEDWCFISRAALEFVAEYVPATAEDAT